MIYTGSDDQNFVPFDGAGQAETDDDVVVVLQDSDPLVLEDRANVIGGAQVVGSPSRGLMGVQLGGAGKGKQFTLTMLFSNILTAPSGLDSSEMQFDASGQGAGLRLFLYSGSSEPELNHRKQDALARARAFAVGWTSVTWRGFEMAGSSDGRTFMGMFLIHRATPA